MRLLLKIILLLCISETLFANANPSFTKEEQEFITSHQKIIIGSLNSYAPFSFLKNNKKVGFTQDLLEIISQKSGLKFEKVSGTWPEIFGYFKNGELDIISEISFSKARQEFTLFTDPYYEIPIGVFTQKDFGPYIGLVSLKGKKVAILKNSFVKPILDESLGITLVEFPSNDEKFYALQNKEVDAVLSSSMHLIGNKSLILKDIKLAGYFNHSDIKKEDLRFGINKDKPLLASIINKTLNSIPYSTITKLQKQWIYEEIKQDPLISLSDKEQKWIDENIVSIGIEDAKPYIFYNTQINNIDGLYSDILKLVIHKTGLQTNYIHDSWNNLLGSFKKKKLDLLPATFYSKQREQFGYFSYPYYKVREYIFVKNKNETIFSFHDLEDKKVAIVKNYATIEKIKEKFPKIKIVQTKDLSESTSLVLNGKVDALIDYHLVVESFLRENSIVGIKGVAQSELFATSVHFLSHIDKPILKDILQKGLNAISREEESKILRQWVRVPYGDNLEDLSLSFKESEFLQKHPTVRFRVRPHRPPFEFDQEGKAFGIAVDYIKKSAKNVGLNAEFIINNDPIAQAYKTISTTRDTYDTLLYSVKNEQREKNFSFGTAFLSYPVMIITHKNSSFVGALKDLNQKTIALEKGFLTNTWIKKDYPQIKIKTVSSTKEALQLVNDEKVFAYVGNLAISNYMNKFRDMENLKIAAPTEYGNINFNFIAPKEWPELSSLLSKGYKKISAAEHSAIQQKWFSLQTIEKTNYTLLIQIIIGALFIIIWILWWSSKVTIEKNKTKKALQQLKIAQDEKLQSQQLLFNQSKIAAMGEMIGNIAHQWRQPLSVISTASTGALMQKEVGELDDEKLIKTLSMINEHAQYLSSTIDTFRDYIKTQKEYKEVILQDRIELALKIIRASFANNYIAIKTNLDELEPIKIKLVVGELSEVLINILNNSKDAIKENHIKDPWVNLEVHEQKEKIIISIEDNAGGIPEDVLPKIFDPYFTTKHQSQGTGLGLHMSYKIITESLKGNISAINTKNGAKVIIELPLEQN